MQPPPRGFAGWGGLGAGTGTPLGRPLYIRDLRWSCCAAWLPPLE